MAIHSVKNDRNRVVAHIRTHAHQFVSLTQVRRWTYADARLVADELTRLVLRMDYEAAVETNPAPEVLPPTTDMPGPSDQPPLRGPGSSRAAWVDYARAKGVQVTGTMNREAILAAVQEREAALAGV